MAYKLEREEQEIVISKCDDEKHYCCTSSSPQHSKQLIKIAEAMNLAVTHLNAYTIRVYLPLNCLALKVPRILSDTHKSALQKGRNEVLH